MKPWFIPAFILLNSQPSLADINPQSIAFNCRNCHSQQVQGTQPVSLEQFSVGEIRENLLNFKYDKKSATLMPRIAKGYSDAELSAVAEFLGKP